ncbi:S-adenosyl-L-methionine-dependent methyltransferase [Phycomyces nitens]|nr:S-adenosyl-L-methionine-dependent methyltransferase [Phycomyces nitens]
MGAQISRKLKPKSSSRKGSTSQPQSSSCVSSESRYHNVPSSSYWLASDRSEQDRMMGEHFAVKELLGGNIMPKAMEILDFEKGIKALDVGCGPGTWVLDVATEYPDSEITGIDMCNIFPQTIRPPNTNFLVVNVLDGLPFEDNSFDFIQIRQLIAALTIPEWPIVVGECVRVLKPGGILQIAEGNYKDSGEGSALLLVQTVRKFCQMRNQDPFVGARIHQLMEDAGLEVLDRWIRNVNHGDGSKAAIEWIWDWCHFADTMRDVLAPFLNIPDSEYDAFITDVEVTMKKSNFHTNANIAIGQKPFA